MSWDNEISGEEYLEGPGCLGKIYNSYDESVLDEDLDDIRAIFAAQKAERNIAWLYDRIDWEKHVMKLSYTHEFDQRFRMSENMFEFLLEALRDNITVNFKKSMNSTGGGNTPIYPELIQACGLRFLAGDTITSLADLYGISTDSTRQVINMFLNAVDSNTEFDPMQIKLPENRDLAALYDLSRRWEEVSTSFGLFNGLIGAIDGWIPRTEKPRNVSNSADYFSGHYQMFGLNVQTICDPDLLFLYTAVAAPGKTNDVRAFARLRDLRTWLEGLPDEFFIAGDNAYPLSRTIMIPFENTEYKAHEWNRVFNFYLSQLRIRIEMAFGRMTTRWRRLRQTLNFSIAKNAQIIRVCMKLHKYVIRMQQAEGGGRVPRFEGDGASVNPATYGI